MVDSAPTEQRSDGSVSEPEIDPADVLSAMSDPDRRAILRVAMEAHPDGVAVPDVTEETDLPADAVDRHADDLVETGLLERDNASGNGDGTPVYRAAILEADIQLGPSGLSVAWISAR